MRDWKVSHGCGTTVMWDPEWAAGSRVTDLCSLHLRTVNIKVTKRDFDKALWALQDPLWRDLGRTDGQGTVRSNKGLGLVHSSSLVCAPVGGTQMHRKLSSPQTGSSTCAGSHFVAELEPFILFACLLFGGFDCRFFDCGVRRTLY